MSATKRDRNVLLVAASGVEPSSWWPFVAIVLGALGCYGLLAVHLLLDATHAHIWGLAWIAVPSVFFAGSVAMVLIASGMPVRERVAVIPAAFLGYSPRRRSRPPSTPPSREPV
jgi:hypothetical protein